MIITKDKAVTGRELSELLSDFSLQGLSERYHRFLKYCNLLTENCSCSSYEFILSITKLVEAHGNVFLETATEITDNFLQYNSFCNISQDAAFVAAYYVAICYNRSRQKENMKNFLLRICPAFENEYPLFYELTGRFCTMNTDFINTYRLSNRALTLLKEQKIENVAAGITYASSVSAIAEHCFLNGRIYHQNESVSDGDEDAADISCERILKNQGSFSYDYRDLSNEKLALALQRVEEAIRYNRDYPKYYFLKGKLLFYRAFYEQNMISEETVRTVRNLIQTALEKLSATNKNYSVLSEEYNRLDYIVKNCPTQSERWFEAEGYLFEKAKNTIIRATDAKQVQPRIYEHGTNVPHVFVSYSSKDFRVVYCDLIELKRNGIYCDYDNEMFAYEEVGDETSKQKWYIAIESKIRAAECVICYISPSYICSDAILLELKLIEKYRKPIIAIDLSGTHIVSRLFVRIAQDETYARSITSEKLYWCAKKFEDDNNVIMRSADPMITGHIQSVKNRIFFLCPNVINVLDCSYCSETGNADHHPQEDYCLVDTKNNIYLVADGITRQDKSEYALMENRKTSISYRVGEAFCNAFHHSAVSEIRKLKIGEDLSDGLKASFTVADQIAKRIIDEYLPMLPPGAELPGCVAIAAIVHNDTLYFGSVGDCMGILIRNGKKIIFADKQTTFAFRKLGIEKDRERLQKEFINHPQNRYGYGVINGDPAAQEFFHVSHLSIQYGDSIYLMSDGVSDYIQYCNPSEYEKMSVKDILSEARKAFHELNGPEAFCDDMTLIRIRWTGDGQWLSETPRE